MRKIEQKLLECFKKRNEFNQSIDKISVDSETRATFYYNYGSLVFAKNLTSEGEEIIYFCLPSFNGYLSSTTKSRVNTFLNEYGLIVQQKNYKYFCNDKEIELDKIYFIIKDDKGNYNIK